MQSDARFMYEVIDLGYEKVRGGKISSVVPSMTRPRAASIEAGIASLIELVQGDLSVVGKTSSEARLA